MFDAQSGSPVDILYSPSAEDAEFGLSIAATDSHLLVSSITRGHTPNAETAWLYQIVPEPSNARIVATAIVAAHFWTRRRRWICGRFATWA